MEWAYKVARAQRDLASLESSRVCTVRYEDLLLAPEERLKEICSFLSVDFDPHMLDFWKYSGKFIGGHHSQKIFEPVSPENLNKWKTRMLPSELARFHRVAGKELRNLGYEITSDAPQGQRLRIAWDLAYGIPCRLAKVVQVAAQLKISSRFGLSTGASGKGSLPEGGKP